MSSTAVANCNYYVPTRAQVNRGKSAVSLCAFGNPGCLVLLGIGCLQSWGNCAKGPCRLFSELEDLNAIQE